MGKCDQCGWPHTTIQERQQERKRLFQDIVVTLISRTECWSYTEAREIAMQTLQASEDFAKEGE
jgi:predicted HTH domain antitoxin